MCYSSYYLEIVVFLKMSLKIHKHLKDNLPILWPQQPGAREQKAFTSVNKDVVFTHKQSNHHQPPDSSHCQSNPPRLAPKAPQQFYNWIFLWSDLDRQRSAPSLLSNTLLWVLHLLHYVSKSQETLYPTFMILPTTSARGIKPFSIKFHL